MEKNVMKILLVGLVIVLAVAGAAVAQEYGGLPGPATPVDVQDSETEIGIIGEPIDITDGGTTYYNTDGSNVKQFVLRLGSTAIVDRVLFIKLNDIKYEVGGFNNAASLMISHALVDIAPGQISDYVLKEGESTNLVDYTISVVKVGENSVVMAVQKRGIPGTRIVRLNEKFNLGTGELAIVDNNLKVEMDGFLETADFVGSSPVVRITLSEFIGYNKDHSLMRAVMMPKSFNLGVGETADYLKYRLKFLSVENSRAVFVVTLKTIDVPKHVRLNERFSLGQKELAIVNNNLKVEMNGFLYAADIVGGSPVVKVTLYDYISDPRIMRAVRSPESFNLAIGKTADYLNYRIKFLSVDNSKAVFIVTQKSIPPIPLPTLIEANFNEKVKVPLKGTAIYEGEVKVYFKSVDMVCEDHIYDARDSYMPPSRCYAAAATFEIGYHEKIPVREQKIIISRADNYFVNVAWYDTAGQSDIFATMTGPKGQSVGRYNLGRFKGSDPNDVNKIVKLGYLERGTEVVISIRTEWWGKWYPMVYSTDSKYFMIEKLDNGGFKLKGDDGIKYDNNYNDVLLYIEPDSAFTTDSQPSVTANVVADEVTTVGITTAPDNVVVYSGGGSSSGSGTISYATKTVTVNLGKGSSAKFGDYVIRLLDLSEDYSIFVVQRTFDIAIEVEIESCYDAVRNQGERGVDCGGPCVSCITDTVDESIEEPYDYVCAPGCVEVENGCLCPKLKIRRVSTGYEIQSSTSAEPVYVKQIKISPGSDRFDVITESGGEVQIGADELDKGVEFDIGDARRVKVVTNKEKLETYFSDGEIFARTRVTIVFDEDKGLAVNTRAGLKEIVVLPEEAAERAREATGLTFQRLELKEKSEGLQYEATTDIDYKLLGLIRVKGTVLAIIDAETGEVLDVKVPWFAFLSSED